ncbi:uncharacterized protein [Rutidosis leptorrhynchoides]|uniref:uncharacterized protein n=1 Tax=Rutidosis leptorrhynchoides TaxID=125765 RepID=UPI003A99EA98
MAWLELFRLKMMWGNYSFDYACSLSRGTWVSTNVECYMVNVYGPQNSAAKANLWERLLQFMNINVGDYIIFGDMNEVRNENESFGSNFDREEARVFNNFIGNAGLEQISLNGRRFTWMNKSATKMSRIDRIFVSLNAAVNMVEHKLVALNREHSDHL